jgi:hypothetical protein
MNPTVTAALVAATAAALGWLVSYVLTVIAARRSLRQTAALKHIERQLEELYGPIAFLILEGRQTFRELLASLGRSYVFIEGVSLPPDELKTWLFWVENDFLPRNERLKTLLSTKTHLLDSPDIPRSYLAFLDHHNSWHINQLRWQKEGVEYSWQSKINWPESFEEDVLDAFRMLKARHTDLLQGQL